MNGQRLNLDAIERSLRDVQRNFPCINKILQNRRDELADEVIANMMAGYRAVDRMIAESIDPFAMGQLRWLLELNACVLCGTEPSERKLASAHLAATEQRFYDNRDGGIRDVVEWYEMHRGESVWKRAAGVYVRVLSEPQLFIEGNHRTGALIMSFILARENKAPFVLTVKNAKAYFDPSTMIAKTKRHAVTSLFKLPKIKSNFAEFLRGQADPSLLRPD